MSAHSATVAETEELAAGAACKLASAGSTLTTGFSAELHAGAVAGAVAAKSHVVARVKTAVRADICLGGGTGGSGASTAVGTLGSFIDFSTSHHCSKAASS